jgi:hypothetical protein
VVVVRSSWLVVARYRKFPVEAAMATRRTARCPRGGTVSRLYRRRVGKGVHASLLRLVRH